MFPIYSQQDTNLYNQRTFRTKTRRGGNDTKENPLLALIAEVLPQLDRKRNTSYYKHRMIF
jgi:hypothetical protein